MDADGAGREQARLLRLAIRSAGLGLPQVWLHYFSIGGDAAEIEIDAFLHHALPLPPLERDVLAHAVNELIDARPVHYAPYSFDLADAREARRWHSSPGETVDDDEA